MNGNGRDSQGENPELGHPGLRMSQERCLSYPGPMIVNRSRRVARVTSVLPVRDRGCFATFYLNFERICATFP